MSTYGGPGVALEKTPAELVLTLDAPLLAAPQGEGFLPQQAEIPNVGWLRSGGLVHDRKTLTVTALIGGRQLTILQRVRIIYVLAEVQDRPISSSDRFFVSGIME